MRLLPALLATSLLALVAAPQAQAWGRLGHRLTGELAERHLSPAARAEVAQLLAGEPEPTLGGVASWADDLRDADPERFKATSTWHYVKTPEKECRYEAARDCPDGACVVGAIQAQQRILADRTQPLAARRDALKFIVHFVGDVHQPFHANHYPDLGGNRFQVSLTTPIEPEAYARKRYVDGVMGTNLHSIWDYYVLASLGMKAPDYLARLDALPWPPTDPEAATTLLPAAWSGESCRLIDARGLYPDTHKMDHGYLEAMRPLAEQRVRQGAWRLAQLLDATLGR